VTTGLLMVTVQYIQALPVVYKTLFTIPNLVLMNVMACRVFRHLKLGDFVDASTINHPGVPFNSVRVDHSGDRKTSDISSGRRPSTNEDSPKTTMVILVERITEQHQDGSERKDDEKEHE